MATINLQLEIIPGNKVKIPGCEPTSIQSPSKLASTWRKICCDVLIDLDQALRAIPGSYIKYGNNFNNNFRKSWFVLPSKDTNCPCTNYTDYYTILRNLPCEDEDISEQYHRCDTIGMGWCESDFDQQPPPKYPYITPGLPLDKKVLPIIPDWIK